MKSPDRKIEPLVVVERTGIEHYEFIGSLGKFARTENLCIRIVHDRGQLRRRNRTRKKPLFPDVVGDDDVIRKCGRNLLNLNQSLKRYRRLRSVKLAGIKFWDNVVNVQNDFGTAKLGNDCRKDFEIRHRMDVNQIVTTPQLRPRK